MTTEDKNTPQNPPVGLEVFIATHTAIINGTPLTAYVGRLNGEGPKRSGVKLSDFTRALDGKRRQTLSHILGGFTEESGFDLGIFCLNRI